MTSTPNRLEQIGLDEVYPNITLRFFELDPHKDDEVWMEVDSPMGVFGNVHSRKKIRWVLFDMDILMLSKLRSFIPAVAG